MTNDWEKLIEQLADIEHQRWSDWHNYARKNWTLNNIDRWDLQAKTPYSKLSNKEKQSDREQVYRYLPILKQEIEAAEKRGRIDTIRKIHKEIDEYLDENGFAYGEAGIDDILSLPSLQVPKNENGCEEGFIDKLISSLIKLHKNELPTQHLVEICPCECHTKGMKPMCKNCYEKLINNL